MSLEDRFAGGAAGGGGGGDENLLLYHHHHHLQLYHVPQHSRREKLRVPAVESAASTSLLLLPDPDAAPPPIYHTGPLSPFLSSSSSSSSMPYISSSSSSTSSSSSSSSYYYCQNLNDFGFAPFTQFLGHNALPLPLNQQQQQISHAQRFSLSLSSAPCSAPKQPPPPPPPRHHQFSGRPAPFTFYLESARKLLEEVCDVGHVITGGASGGGGSGSTSSGEMLLDAIDPAAAEGLVDHERTIIGLSGCPARESEQPIQSAEQQWKKTRLISMLDEVCRRYKQYFQQVHYVITSFESVAGLTNAAPYASMALKAMSKHFRSIKSSISEQLRHMNKVISKESLDKEDISPFGLVNGSGCLQRVTNIPATLGQPHVWRPQRGLPERAVAVLRTWLFDHFLHPYPTDSDKQILAKQTGLTRNQVSNWFINARVRIWKPMVEEIHSLQMQQLHNKNSNSRDQPAARPSTSSAVHFSSQCDNKNIMSRSIQLRREPNEHEMHSPISEPANFAFDREHVRIGPSFGGARNGGVSLTLGLHQNNVNCQHAEQVPVTIAPRCFGFEECNGGHYYDDDDDDDDHMTG